LDYRLATERSQVLLQIARFIRVLRENLRQFAILHPASAT
jgi:hypothetical protein